MIKEEEFIQYVVGKIDEAVAARDKPSLKHRVFCGTDTWNIGRAEGDTPTAPFSGRPIIRKGGGLAVYERMTEEPAEQYQHLPRLPALYVGRQLRFLEPCADLTEKLMTSVLSQNFAPSEGFIALAQNGALYDSEQVFMMRTDYQIVQTLAIAGDEVVQGIIRRGTQGIDKKPVETAIDQVIKTYLELGRYFR